MFLRRITATLVGRLCAALTTAMVALQIGIAHAEDERATRALLIGVSNYTDGLGMADLRGPANDVRLMREVLKARGVMDIRVLADGVLHQGKPSPAPTRARIVEAMTNLARTAKEGELIIITMSGHGTQQRDISGDEDDGRDEVFLPADTARSEDGSGLIPNAIIDDELGAMVSAIRNTGADVWLVVDSCNSSSAQRAGGPRTAARFTDPAVLGVSFDTNTARTVKDPLMDKTKRSPPAA